MTSAMSIVHNDIFIFDNVMSISLRVPSITIVLSMGNKNCKNRLSEGYQRFLSNFPFVNLQIKSIVASLRPIMSCTQSMKIISDLLKNVHFWVKNRFSEILKFLRICWSDLIDSIGFLDAVDMD